VPSWYALGMRATGSHDIAIDGAFVPDASIAARRPQGQWHPMFHLISMIALPLICSVYVGVAQAARDAVVRLAGRRTVGDHAVYLIGGIENELRAAELALADMIAAATGTPGFETTNRVMIGRTLVGRSVLKLVDLAMEAGGGGAFYRAAGIERLFRDAQAVRYHPLQEGAQRDYAARMALGLEIRA
jgi:alkylation response protein AidB-like acyl-CoA dehydrogenase